MASAKKEISQNFEQKLSAEVSRLEKMITQEKKIMDMKQAKEKYIDSLMDWNDDQQFNDFVRTITELLMLSGSLDIILVATWHPF